MLENIGIWVYLYTIVDRLSITATFGAIVFGVFTIGAYFVYGAMASHYRDFGRTERAQNAESKRKAVMKATIPTFALCLLLSIFVPTRDDVKLIAGVVVGVKVAEQTIETVSESEIVGKVFDIVEKKIDNVLTDMDNTNKEDKK